MRASRLYDEYDRSLCDAWKGQPENKLTGIGSGEFGAHAREGDVCTVDGAPGHINAEGKCVVDNPNWVARRAKLDANAHRSRMAQQAYDAYDRELTNAWRMR